MLMKRFVVFLILVLAISVGSVFAQNFVAHGYDWNNPRTQISQFFTVGEVFTNGRTVDWARRDALFALPQNERDAVIANILRMAQHLDAVRTQYGAIRVTSWYRDRETNRRVGGASNSAHIQGHGVDIRPLNFDAAKMEEELEASWRGGLGRGQAKNRGFTHLDLGTQRRWDY